MRGHEREQDLLNLSVHVAEFFRIDNRSELKDMFSSQSERPSCMLAK